jgi:hypothetical protein
MLELADSIRRDGVLRLHGEWPDGRGAVIHVFVCRDWRDVEGAPHQPKTSESDHPVHLFAAFGPGVLGIRNALVADHGTV